MPKQIFRFERIIIQSGGRCVNLKYFPKVLELYVKYMRYLEDDFSLFKLNALDALVEYIRKISPHFYLVISNEEVCGFFALENLIGNNENIFSAQVITCFFPKYWGVFTKQAGLIFTDFCFDILGIQKLKAVIYPENARVKSILKICGFEKEAFLKSETLRNGCLQDIEVYSVFNTTRKKEV